MKSLVVYSSQTGNTRKLAEAVAQYRKQAHAIPARSMDEPDFAGAALIDALCYWRRNAGTGCESFCDDGFHYGVGDNRFGAVTGGDGGTGQKICPYQKCPGYGFVHSHKYSDSVNLLRLFSGQLMKTDGNGISADYDFLFQLDVCRPVDAVHSIRFAGGWIPGKHPGQRLSG